MDHKKPDCSPWDLRITEDGVLICAGCGAQDSSPQPVDAARTRAAQAQPDAAPYADCVPDAVRRRGIFNVMDIVLTPYGRGVIQGFDQCDRALCRLEITGLSAPHRGESITPRAKKTALWMFPLYDLEPIK